MATVETATPDGPPRIVLRGVSWKVYLALRADAKNQGVRMAYHDGTLELSARTLLQERSASRLGVLVRIVAMGSGVSASSARSTTLQRRIKGRKKKKGTGLEPDESFSFANAWPVPNPSAIDLTVAPPPDLAIEVDVAGDPMSRLALYARLGVPELWIFDAGAETIWFGQLQPDGSYRQLDRSLCLPILTPNLVLEMLARGVDQPETAWALELLDRVHREVGPHPPPPP